MKVTVIATYKTRKPADRQAADYADRDERNDENNWRVVKHEGIYHVVRTHKLRDDEPRWTGGTPYPTLEV